MTPSRSSGAGTGIVRTTIHYDQSTSCIRGISVVAGLIESYSNMNTYTNYQFSEETWENLYSVKSSSNVDTVPTAKQRCQANARERDRTQKLV